MELRQERLHGTDLTRGALSALACLRLARARRRTDNELRGALDMQRHEDRGLWVRRQSGLPVCGLLRTLACRSISEACKRQPNAI